MKNCNPEHPVVAEDTGVGQPHVQIHARGASFHVDEPASMGGLGSGPSPFELLSASLGACTVMTIKFYAQRKKIPVTHVQVLVFHNRHAESGRDVFRRSIFVDGAVDEGQMRQLMSVADHCPVSRALSAGADIETTRYSTPFPTNRRVEDDTHVRAMEKACDEVPDPECLTG